MPDLDALADWTVKYIDTHLSATLSVKEISAELKLDPGDVERAFRRVMGMTIKRYIGRRLMERVDYLLASGERSGYEIGIELGFSSDRAFYRWVKRVYDVSFRKLKSEKYLSSSKSQGGEAPRSTSK
jgi:AraC-like DNA-binding protein